MLNFSKLIFGLLLLISPMFLIGQQLTNITDVTLTFTPVGGGSAITATANDPDGDGTMSFQASSLNLLESTEYTLDIDVQNTIDNVNSTSLIQQNSDDFLFFFGFTDDNFTSPAGDGNVDNRPDPMNYNDTDGNNLPVGLSTTWEAECADVATAGTFQVILKYQPSKTASSSSSVGTTEFDISWDVSIAADPNAPPCENEEEIITDVTLTFTPTGGGSAVTAAAQDSDGPGPLPLQISNDIELLESTEYEMSITLFNSIEGEDITEEIMEEDDEHMFFFAFTDDNFTSPAGDGNTDNRADPINYNDFDFNNLPVGLSTTWEAECAEVASAGTFQVILKHQPDVKTATSTVNDGGTDVDLTWNVSILADPNAPPCENEEEIITDVTLTFTPTAGGSAITASAQDPDGPGPLPLQILDDIELVESTEYEMSITLFNSIEGEDITEEIMEEDDEHMFFFAFTDDNFTSPAGDGNVDNRADPINYNDFDGNNLPVGLSTTWEAECADVATGGTFQVILKHQPDVKSTTSTVNDGGTDVDLTWNVSILADPNAPPCENEEEIITDVTLTFTPTGGGITVTASAQDPDGPGPLPLQILDDVELVENTEYEMSITLFNSIEGEDITAEIMEEDDEHMFFFAFTDGNFTSPTGNGNVDNRNDPMNYNDFDGNNLPVGLSTNWETASAGAAGTFQVILKHQPDIKSATSTVNDGGTDVDLTWIVSIVELAICNQSINLNPGWNLISFNNSPEDNSVSAVFDDLITAENLEFVTGFDNGGFIFDPELPDFINTLQTIDNGFGYWVKVTNATTLASSSVCIGEDYRKPLDAGWNLIAYPPLAPQAPSDYFADLIATDNLEIATGFDSGTITYDPDLPDFINTLSEMQNGFGYWVKVNNPAAKTASTLTNVFSFIYGTTNLPYGEQVQVLNEIDETIAIIDAIEAGYLMTTPVYGDDETTIVKEYINKGEKLRFSWNGQIADFTSTFKGDYGIEQIHLEFKLNNNFQPGLNVVPNPIADKADIIYNLAKSDNVTVALFDASGKQLITLIENQTLQAGEHIIELNVKNLVSGIYFLKVQGRENNTIRKLMITSGF